MPADMAQFFVAVALAVTVIIAIAE